MKPKVDIQKLGQLADAGKIDKSLLEKTQPTPMLDEAVQVPGMDNVKYPDNMVESVDQPAEQSRMPDSMVEKTPKQVAEQSNEVLRDHLDMIEGNHLKPYQDTKGIWTIGRGANMQLQEVKDFLTDKGYDVRQLISGKQEILPEEAEKLYEMQVSQRKEDLSNILSAEGVSLENLNPNRQNALVSLYFNSPKLVGNNLKKYLKDNDIVGASKEIALKSNRNSVPGIARRRLYEARMFAGDQWADVVDSMTKSERVAINNLVNRIKSSELRNNLKLDFPELFNNAPLPTNLDK